MYRARSAEASTKRVELKASGLNSFSAALTTEKLEPQMRTSRTMARSGEKRRSWPGLNGVVTLSDMGYLSGSSRL